MTVHLRIWLPSCLVILLSLPATVFAQSDTTWIAAGGGQFADAANWDNGVPGANDVANFDLLASYTIELDAVERFQKWNQTSGNVTLSSPGASRSIFVSEFSLDNSQIVFDRTNIRTNGSSTNSIKIANGSIATFWSIESNGLPNLIEISGASTVQVTGNVSGKGVTQVSADSSLIVDLEYSNGRRYENFSTITYTRQLWASASNGTGWIEYSGDVVLNSTVDSIFDVESKDEFDSISIEGDLTLAGGFRFNVANEPLFLFEGDEIVLMSIDGDVVGQFDGLSEGDEIEPTFGDFGGDLLASFSYSMGDGNDIGITILRNSNAIPEPSALFLLVMCSSVFRFRRRGNRQ